MGFLLSWLVSNGLPESRARKVATGLPILLVILLLWLGKLAYDRSLISRHDASQAAETASADRAADATAATRRREDDARLEAEADALEKVTENAALSNPRAARRAYYDCVRLQQQARQLGRLTPAC